MITFGETDLFELVLKKYREAGSPQDFFRLRFDNISKDEKRLLLAWRDMWVNKKLRRECSEFLLVPEYSYRTLLEKGYHPKRGFVTDGAALPEYVNLKYVDLEHGEETQA